MFLRDKISIRGFMAMQGKWDWPCRRVHAAVTCHDFGILSCLGTVWPLSCSGKWVGWIISVPVMEPLLSGVSPC